MSLRYISFFLLSFSVCGLYGQARMTVGNKDFSDWSGISISGEEAVFKNESTISYRYPDGVHHFKGFRKFYGHAKDWSLHAGLSFEIYLEKASTTTLEISLKVDERDADVLQPVSHAKVQLARAGWQTVYLPWSVFDLMEGLRIGTLQAVKQLDISARSNDNPTLKIRNVGVVKGELVYLDAPVRGQSVDAGHTIEYEVEVGNTTFQPQLVQLSFSKYGWESMTASVEPASVELAPLEVKKIKVTVRVPDGLPTGIREKQVLHAVANGQGSAASSLELTSAVKVPAPSIFFTRERWDEVRDKIDKYDWAREQVADYEARAQKWVVKDVAKKALPRESYRGIHLYHEREASSMFNCAIAYQLTGKTEYAAKCLDFLRRFSSLENGYPNTLRANAANFVKEGGFFQDIARGYDMIATSGLVTAEDEKLIKNSFRIYVDVALKGNSNGAIGNWDLSELSGALYCALVLQDWHLAERILTAPAGIYQQLAQGVLNDGWWHECAVGYNLWCSRMFSQVAIALEPWGMNFKDMKLPLGTTPNHSLLPRRNRPGRFGMNFMKWGKLNNNSIGIKDMWDAPLNFLDYRGVMFAVNDATEAVVSGADYELAYFLYRDPEYAAIIQRGDNRDLLYGVPELPDVTSEKISQSAYADNMGIVQLRSQTPGRVQKDQIQAVLHYGTHGGGHGHYDRTQFISMMRYGRSFYNPEMYWYGYQSYLYKFLVQTSINKNMVVVDQKMQEPAESFRKLFYTGDMMQAAVVESDARWAHPPYFGMVYDGLNMTVGEKAWSEGRSIYIPEKHPEYGELTGFTDTIMQRRLMVMMDDYVVLADFLESDSVRTYDWLMQIKGFKSLTADKKKFLRHVPQMNADPLGAAQFTTDCDWYQTSGTSRASFEMCFGEGCDNGGARMRNSEDGPLKIDVFNAWPNKSEVMIGTAPENFSVEKKLWYTVEADEEVLVSDSTGAWILGSRQVEVDLRGKKELVLTTRVDNNRLNTIFWGDAKLLKADGSQIYLSSLDLDYENMVLPTSKGMDYYEGPIKIAGELMPQSIPGMPDHSKKTARITIDLNGLDIVAFQANLGGDFPLGDETSRRKTLAVRSKGKQARFLSVIEPFEKESVIKSVKARSANELEVELLDGRVQQIFIDHLDGDGSNIKVYTKEFLNGKLLREESTK